MKKQFMERMLNVQYVAKKLKVGISIGHGGQSCLVHIGQVFPIDAKRKDIIKEKSGVLSFSSIGMGETFFQDTKSKGMKCLYMTTKILDAEEKCTPRATADTVQTA